MNNLQASKRRLLAGLALFGLANLPAVGGSAAAQNNTEFTPCSIEETGKYGGFSNVGVTASRLASDNKVDGYGTIKLPTWQLGGDWNQDKSLMDVQLLVHKTSVRPTRNSPRTVSGWKGIAIELPVIKDKNGNIAKALFARVKLGDGSILPVIKADQSDTTKQSRFFWHDENEYFGKGGGKIGKYLADPKGEISVMVTTTHPDQSNARPVLEFVYDAASIAPAKKQIDSKLLPRLQKMENQKKCKAAPVFEGCFLTTAACEGLGLDDDCWELRTLRNFRDNWLKLRPEGQRDIAEYYAKAPQMADDIRGDQRALVKAYWKWVLPSALMARAGLNRMAHRHYAKGMRVLAAA